MLFRSQSSLNVKKSVTTRLPSVYIGNGLDHAEDNVADTQGESTVAGDQLISDGPDQTQGECPEDIGRQPHGRELLPLTAHDDIGRLPVADHVTDVATAGDKGKNH